MSVQDCFQEIPAIGVREKESVNMEATILAAQSLSQ